MHQRPALAGRDHHLLGAGHAVAMGILARAVNVKAVMGVFDGRHGQPAARQQLNELDQ